VGTASSHTTHASRGSAARIAKLNGASLDKIRRISGWERKSLQACYLTHLPTTSHRPSVLASLLEERGTSKRVTRNGISFGHILGKLSKR
jgi:hypothetical protein